MKDSIVHSLLKLDLYYSLSLRLGYLLDSGKLYLEAIKAPESLVKNNRFERLLSKPLYTGITMIPPSGNGLKTLQKCFL